MVVAELADTAAVVVSAECEAATVVETEAESTENKPVKEIDFRLKP